MPLTNSQIELLREVIGGKTVFGPKSASDEDMNAFQILAEEIIELCENGYLTGCRPHRESSTGKRQIDLISVAGITASGRRSAQASPNTTTPQNNVDQDTFCPKCNHSLRPAAKFCDDCGFSLASINDSTLPMVQTSRSAPVDSFIGLLLREKYQIISEIGKGGMGHVYRARHLGLSEDIAIKVIDKKFVSDADAVERFKREARAAAKLRHPNVIGILDIDETPEPDRRPYIVMELVEGKSLKTVLAEEGKLKIDRAVALIVEICKAVSFAHRQGVIHRDIKPDNIMVMQRDGEVGESIKVLDFGLAKMRESKEQPSITHVGTLMGTPFYMSPEQCRGEELDARSDVYSLATVLYEMISGVPPFSGSNVTSVCSQHQSAPVPVLDPSLNVPDEILTVLNRGLAKSREDRPSDAQQFSLELQAAYAHFSNARTEAALAETVEEQKGSSEESSELIASLTRTDTLVLKVSCELALKTGHSDLIETSKILEALHEIGIVESEVWESLELLDECGYIDAHRVLGGGRPFQVYSLKPRGFHEYAKSFIPDYNELIDRVIRAIGINELEDNFLISEDLNRPVLLINFILDLLENDALLTQSKRLGGRSVVSRVSVELRRLARKVVVAEQSQTAPIEPTEAPALVVPVIESHRTSADNVGKIDYYAFRVSMRNVSEKTIRNFRLEVEVPNAYADPTHQGSMSEEVRRVVDNSIRYRHTQDQFPGFVLYPNDTSPILMNTNYQMRFDQYETANGSIKVSVYIDDKLAGRTEYSIRDNRNKDRMVQLGIEPQTGNSLTEKQLQDIRSDYFRYGQARCPRDEAVLRVIELQSDEQVMPGLIITCPLCGLDERIDVTQG
jgi:serine/threonine protein kinase